MDFLERFLLDGAGGPCGPGAGGKERCRNYAQRRHGGIADRSMIALLTGPRGSASWSLRALRRARYAAWRSAGVWACWPAGGRPRRRVGAAAGSALLVAAGAGAAGVVFMTLLS